MKYAFGDQIRDPESRAELIRFKFVPGSTIAEHTDKCISEGVWSKSELLALATRGCKNVVRDALGAVIDGLPFAGPTTKTKKGKPKWQQMHLWKEPDYFFNCSLRVIRTETDIEVHNAMVRNCWQRFNHGPNLRVIKEVPYKQDADGGIA